MGREVLRTAFPSEVAPTLRTMPSSRTAEPRQLSPFSHGRGRVVTLEGTRECAECGAEVSIQFRGATDSLGARVSRQWLRKGKRVLCTDCIEREDSAMSDAELAERRNAAYELRVERSSVPPRWRPVTFEGLDWDVRTPALEAARKWAQAEKPKGLLLHGDVGRGKTLIAAAAAMERLKGQRLKWLSVAGLLTNLRSDFSAPEYKQALRSIDPERARGALILDDLDKTKPSEHQLQPLYVAINGWTERPLPLLVTMNRSPDELAAWAGETFGEALASRLVGYCEVVEVKGRDRRLS